MKILARLEVTVNGKFSEFFLDHDTEYAVAREMCNQYIIILGNMELKAKEELEAKISQEKEKISESIQEAPKE